MLAVVIILNMMKKEKDFTSDIEQVKEDLLALEREMEIMKAKLDEKQKHKETLQYFLDTIDFE
jgi:hypothetical protein